MNDMFIDNVDDSKESEERRNSSIMITAHNFTSSPKEEASNNRINKREIK